MSKIYVDKLSYLNYATVYSAQGDRDVVMGKHACFAEAINRGTIQKEHYEMYLIRDKRFAIEKRFSNLCLMNEAQLRKHIWLARRLFPFKYTVENSEYDRHPAFKVTIDLDAPLFYHRYLLTWVRYAWEFPYNLIMEDALRMKHQYLPKENIPNLYVLCSDSIVSCPTGNDSLHGIPCGGASFLRECELKARINELSASKYGRLNELYPSKYEVHCKLEKTTDDANKWPYLDYWNDPEEFQERAKIYLRNYKILKQ